MPVRRCDHPVETRIAPVVVGAAVAGEVLVVEQVARNTLGRRRRDTRRRAESSAASHSVDVEAWLDAAEISSAASSSGTSAAPDCMISAKRARTMPNRIATMRRAARSTTLPPHVPRRTSRHPRRQARAHHGRFRLHADLPRARRRSEPAQPAAASRRAASRATTSRSAWRTTTATSRSCGAATTPGSSTPVPRRA